MGKVELLFRPYLRWLDRSMERLFTEGARQVRTVVTRVYVHSGLQLTVMFLFEASSKRLPGKAIHHVV